MDSVMVSLNRAGHVGRSFTGLTVLAVVAAICASYPVQFWMRGPIYSQQVESLDRLPTGVEVLRRIIVWEPVAIVAMICVLSIARPLKSRRENGPPVG